MFKCVCITNDFDPKFLNFQNILLSNGGTILCRKIFIIYSRKLLEYSSNLFRFGFPTCQLVSQKRKLDFPKKVDL